MKLLIFSDPRVEEDEQFTSNVSKLRTKYESRKDVEILELDVRQNPELCERYKVENVPTLIFEEKGMLKRRLEGSFNITEMEKYFTQV